MNENYKYILNHICYKHHKSRLEALEILISLEDAIRYKNDITKTYYLLGLGQLQEYYKKYNKAKGDLN